MPLKIAFFGSSLVSAYWNGAATYYRGLIRALHERGHQITFYEPDAFDRQEHRDIPDPDWARVVVYPAKTEARCLRRWRTARGADLVVKASGVGVFDALLEQAVLDQPTRRHWSPFGTWTRPPPWIGCKRTPAIRFARSFPNTTGSSPTAAGHPSLRLTQLWAHGTCIPIYNALDPHTHYRVAPDRAL